MRNSLRLFIWGYALIIIALLIYINILIRQGP